MGLACGCDVDRDASVCDAGACVPDAGQLVDACPVTGCNPTLPDAGPSCDPSSYPLTRQRLDIMLVVDGSVTMSTWGTVVADELAPFMNDAASSGVGIGLQRFGEVCDAQAFVDPIVPIARLPGNAMPVLDALPTIGSITSSTVPALEGAIIHARDWAVRHREAQVIVLLATDATPGDCDALTADYDTVATGVAARGLQGTPPIRTYVVGFGPLLTIPAIANAGGTQAFVIDYLSAPGATLAAFRGVRDAARPCAFAWPGASPLGAAAQVAVTQEDGDVAVYDVRQGSGGCAPDDTGFVVEDPTAAFPLRACPRTCQGLALSDQLTVNACGSP
ncbi:MAG: hypothetical protein ABW321_03630 [Polyangiales bacterium]